MNEHLRMIAKVVNKAISRTGLQIVRNRPGYGSLDLYPEKERPEVPRYLNIGAGSFYHPYWHNMDTPSSFYANAQRGHTYINYDLTTGQSFPLNSHSLKVVYISHVIEHLTDTLVQFCLGEVFRCLQPGGFFRLTCPDIDIEYDAFCRGDSSVFPWPSPWGTRSLSIEQRFLEHFATALTLDHPEIACHKFTDEDVWAVFSKLPKEDALNFFISQIPLELGHSHPEHHVNWFNVNKIRGMLRKAGFDNAYESRYGQSKCPLMRNIQLFDSTVPSLSLYLECQK